MGIVCCKQDHTQEHTILSHYTQTKPKSRPLSRVVKSRFHICSAKKQRKTKAKRRPRKQYSRGERPSISLPRLLNPKYLTDEKWQNVIFTVPDPKMRTRTPVPPPRKKRKSLISLCTKRNRSVEYVNLCGRQDDHDGNLNSCVQSNLLKSRSYSSESELFKEPKPRERHVRRRRKGSNIKRCVSYENVQNGIPRLMHRDKTSMLRACINRCLLCYINEIMSLLEQQNITCSDEYEYKFKLDEDANSNDDDYMGEVQMYKGEEEDEQQQDGRTILDKETKLSKINEQKLLESFENFCIQCYLNKIQTHPKSREDISSTSTKVEENNLKSSRTGDNNNFSLANRNVGNKISPLGNTHDKKNVQANFLAQTLPRSSVRNGVRASMQTSTFPQASYKCLDKKYDCLFCCMNKKKEEKHHDSGSLYGIYSKKQKYNLFKSDNANEQECKYTIGNKVENKIRNEKLCEINKAPHKSMHTQSNNMLEHFKNLNCCRRRHLNLFKFMCFQCFYVYVQILYILQSSALFEEDFTGTLFKMRKCELMRGISMLDIRVIVNMVLQIHILFSKKNNESNICEICTKLMFNDHNSRPDKVYRNDVLGKYQCFNVNDPKSVPVKPKQKIEHNINAVIKNEIFSNKIENLSESRDAYRKGNYLNHDAAFVSNLSVTQRCAFDKESEQYEQNDPSEKSTEFDETFCLTTLKKNKNSEKQKSNIFKTPKAVINNNFVIPTSETSNQNFNSDNYLILEDTSLKEKFEKLKADLHAKKIKSVASIPKPESEDINSVHCGAWSDVMEQRDVVDANGNCCLDINHERQRQMPSENGTDPESNKMTSHRNLKDTKENIQDEGLPSKMFMRKGSSKRKSQRLNSKDIQILGSFENRRSSVSDSLYELELSLYDMLQNSLAFEDVKYV